MLDTSVLLADPQALERFDEHAVVLPIVVLMELEAKRNHPELGWAARQSLRMLERLRLEHGSLTIPLPANEHGGTLRVELNHQSTAGLPPTMTADNNDHRILAVAHNLRLEGHDVTVVTKDLPLRLKASIVGLDADEYRNELAADTSWTGFVELDVEPDVIDDLFTHREVDLPEAAELPCNTGVALHAGSQSALARVHADKSLRLIRGDLSLFDVIGRSAEQRIALDVLADPSVSIVSLGGNAGTGKSVMALAAGLDAVLERRTHKRILVFRPLYAVGGQDLGFLPGDKDEKMGPWAGAVFDALESIAGPEVVEEVISRNLLEVLPLTHIRGPQPDRHVRDHRRGAEPGAPGAAHGAEPARRGQPGRAHPRRRPARQPAGRAPRRHRLGDRGPARPPDLRPRDLHPVGALGGRRPGHQPARRPSRLIAPRGITRRGITPRGR